MSTLLCQHQLPAWLVDTGGSAGIDFCTGHNRLRGLSGLSASATFRVIRWYHSWNDVEPIPVVESSGEFANVGSGRIPRSPAIAAETIVRESGNKTGLEHVENMTTSNRAEECEQNGASARALFGAGADLIPQAKAPPRRKPRPSKAGRARRPSQDDATHSGGHINIWLSLLLVCQRCSPEQQLQFMRAQRDILTYLINERLRALIGEWAPHHIEPWSDRQN